MSGLVLVKSLFRSQFPVEDTFSFIRARRAALQNALAREP